MQLRLDSRPGRRTLGRLAATALAIPMLAPLAGAQTPASAGGTILRAPDNIANFSPEEVGGVVDASAIDFGTLMASLGEKATLWYQHVQTLSDPFMEGRKPGTRGAALAQDYIEFYFREYGLQPPFPRDPEAAAEFTGDAEEARSYRQPFEFRARASFGTVEVRGASARIGGRELREGVDFVVLGSSGSGSVTGPVSFVGYGIEDGEDGYTSFDADTDLTGRVALLLRYEPLDENGASRWSDDRFSRHSRIAAKLEAVADRGASGIILVNPPGARDGRIGLEPVRRSAGFGRPLDVPVIQVTPPVATRLLQALAPAGGDLASWRRRADTRDVGTVHFSGSVSFGAELSRRTGSVVPAANVGGVLRGRGALADEFVVIGAHQDHVGDGSLGGINPANRGQLHPGADDNASGTAGVLVLAKMLSEAYADAGDDEDLRSILFLTFDAEEMGLHGSRYFSDHPIADPDDLTLLINMDMIGRLRDDSLSVFGTGTAAGLQELLRPHFEASGLKVYVNPSGSGRSDDANFHRIEVPAVHLFTGMTAEYTTPADKAFTVNPAGAKEVLDLAAGIALDVATRPEPLRYRQPEAGRGESRGYARVRLGIRPGMGEREGGGLLVEEVFEGTSADEGGLRRGDVIVAWNGSDLTGARDLFESLQNHQPGDVVRLLVQRDGREVELRITLKGE